MQAEQAIGDSVKRSRPAHSGFLPHDSLGAARHDLGCSPREREEQDAAGISPVSHEVCDAVRECVGLAGAGAGDDEERTLWRGRGSELRGIQIHAPEYKPKPRKRLKRLSSGASGAYLRVMMLATPVCVCSMRALIGRQAAPIV